MKRLTHALRRTAQAVVVFAVPFWAEQAFADNAGTVSGTVRFQEHMGGYCPTWLRDCTGGRYLSSEYDRYYGIRETKLYVRDQDKKVIGEGATDWYGAFHFDWESSTLPTSIHLAWKYEHKDHRFELRQPDGGGHWVTMSSSRTPVNHGDTTFAADLGPRNYANVYDGASRMWHKALSTSGLMESRFSGVRIDVFQEVGCGLYGAASIAEENWVCLASQRAYSAQASVLHELGHIASYVSQTDRATGTYMRDGVDGWSFTSEEYKSVSLEEGIATFFGDVTFYNDAAVEPYTCLTDLYCTNDLYNALEPNTPLGHDERGRWPLSYMRAFWDAFDAASDGRDNSHAAYWYFFTALDEFPSGEDTYDASGVLGPDHECCDEPDVRAGREYNYHMYIRRGEWMAEEFGQNQIVTSF